MRCRAVSLGSARGGHPVFSAAGPTAAPGSSGTEVRVTNRLEAMNNSNGENPNGAALFEAANKLRGSVESAEYKHLVLGLIFLKYISDSFELRREQLEAELADPKPASSTPRTPTSAPRSWRTATSTSPRTSSGSRRRRAGTRCSRPPRSPTSRERIDEALEAIESENPRLRDVLPRIYARAPLVGRAHGLAGRDDRQDRLRRRTPSEARDILGRTYEYFIKEFARAEGHRGGEFFTPAPVARLLVEMLEPYEGRVLDPACGSCGLFVQSAASSRPTAATRTRSRSTARSTTRPPGGSAG